MNAIAHTLGRASSIVALSLSENPRLRMACSASCRSAGSSTTTSDAAISAGSAARPVADACRLGCLQCRCHLQASASGLHCVRAGTGVPLLAIRGAQ